jgi:hypothetical protein
MSLKVSEAESIEELRAASALLEAIWGRTAEGVPVHSEVMKGLVHAGGCVTVARNDGGALIGAAVLSPAAPAGEAYSLIAGVAPGANDRGIGRALKLRQRKWALEHGFTHMTWTFDPLVARNARFNLARLGAVAGEFESAVRSFLGALVPGAPFMMAFMEGSRGYGVHSTQFPAVDVTPRSLDALLADLPVTGTSVLRTDNSVRRVRQGYDAMLFVTGFVTA